MNLTWNERERLAYITGADVSIFTAAEEELVEKFYQGDAEAGFPHEGFLDEPIDRLENLKKKLHGNNKTEVEEIIKLIDEIQTDCINAAEYAREELEKERGSIK